jgi:capsular polysaccharide biosynthesis protein
VWAKLPISKVGTGRNLQPPFPPFNLLNIAKKEIIIIIIIKVPKKTFFLRFSVPRIQPKFKKNRQIFIHGNQVGSHKI